VKRHVVNRPSPRPVSLSGEAERDLEVNVSFTTAMSCFSTYASGSVSKGRCAWSSFGTASNIAEKAAVGSAGEVSSDDGFDSATGTSDTIGCIGASGEGGKKECSGLIRVNVHRKDTM
jgi:hypothetical protein